MTEVPRSYRIVYDVHCRFQNFFGKEIIVKNCYSEIHAKYKLASYCENKYGKEFDFLTFKSVKTEDCTFDDMFGMKDLLGDDKSLLNLLNDLKKKKKC